MDLTVLRLQTMRTLPGQIAVLVACVVPAALASDHFRAAAQTHYAATQTYEDLYYLPPADYLLASSLGYREALADVIWLKALIYFGQELKHRGHVGNLYRYTDAMLTLDPRFKKVYHWVASTAIYRPGPITERDVRKAIAYLERGFRLFPDDGEFAWDLGATYAYELVPIVREAGAKRAAKQRGLTYLELAALRGAGPAWIGLNAAAQLDKLGKTEQAIRHLADLYATVHDPAIKEQIEARLTELRSAAYAEAVRHTDEEIEAARRRDFPYAPTTLYLLLGRRPAFDGMAMLRRNFDPTTDLSTETRDGDN